MKYTKAKHLNVGDVVTWKKFTEKQRVIVGFVNYRNDILEKIHIQVYDSGSPTKHYHGYFMFEDNLCIENHYKAAVDNP